MSPTVWTTSPRAAFAGSTGKAGRSPPRVEDETIDVDRTRTAERQLAGYRNYINTHVWKKAPRAAGVEPTRINGMHALRHY